MLHVIENTDKRVSPKTGDIAAYITASSTGKPVAVDDRDEKMWAVLSAYGTPVRIPLGDLDVTVYASNGFLLTLLA